LLVVAGPRIGVSPAEGGRLAQEALEALAPDAREAGVTLALEPIHPIKIAEYSTVVTLAEARDAVAGIDGTGLLLDIWNSWWEPDLVAELPEVADEVAGVQISDFRAGDDPMDRAPPGEGIAPLGEIVGALERSGYEGWYEVELFTERYDPSAYPDLIETCVSGTARLLSEPDTR
jgi:sugar phosphate isomerase/epimerase